MRIFVSFFTSSLLFWLRYSFVVLWRTTFGKRCDVGYYSDGDGERAMTKDRRRYTHERTSTEPICYWRRYQIDGKKDLKQIRVTRITIYWGNVWAAQILTTPLWCMRERKCVLFMLTFLPVKNSQFSFRNLLFFLLLAFISTSHAHTRNNDTTHTCKKMQQSEQKSNGSRERPPKNNKTSILVKIFATSNDSRILIYSIIFLRVFTLLLLQ